MAVAARGDALDWALALARAPTERVALRQRPLPAGIEPLLQVAVGNAGEALAAAVARTGESEDSLVEAARFYLREVLFHSGADAYRVLGLERTASPERIKTHHRLLQQWLHPDRQTSDWDAIFAGRVNAAWNQLRNEERRRSYDAEHPAPKAPEPAPAFPLGGAWVHQPVIVQSSRERWQRRAPLVALVVACAGLGVLALRDVARDETLAAAVPGEDTTMAEKAPDGLEAFGALHLPQREPVPTPRKVPPRKDAPAGDRAQDRSAIAPIAMTSRPVVASSMPAASKISPVVPADVAAPRAARVRSGDTTAPVPVPVARATAAPRPPTEAAIAAAMPRPDTPSPPAPAAKPIVISSERIRQAQQTGDRLLAFMRARDGRTPPIWDSLPVQQGATRLREELQARGDAGFSQPDWRVGEREAQMVVDVRHADGRHGRLGAGLAWREERWLVTRLSMERDW